MRCFYESDHITRGYQKNDCYLQKIFEITEQRLVDQARVIRTNKWLTEVKLEEIRKKRDT